MFMVILDQGFQIIKDRFLRKAEDEQGEYMELEGDKDYFCVQNQNQKKSAHMRYCEPMTAQVKIEDSKEHQLEE